MSQQNDRFWNIEEPREIQIRTYQAKGYICKVSPEKQKLNQVSYRTSPAFYFWGQTNPLQRHKLYLMLLQSMRKFLSMKFCCKVLSSKMTCSLFDPVALMCNITEMYLQIKLKPDDQPCHRFRLWQNVNTKDDPDVFDRAVLRVNSSPFLGHFATQQPARKHHWFPLSAKRVLKSTQMVSVFDKETGNELYKKQSQLWI